MINSHFGVHTKIVNAGITNKPVIDYKLSRYACYLIVQNANDIAKRKGLRYREDILDHMWSAELGANVFRITQTEAFLKKQMLPDEQIAIDTHYRVGRAIRNVIKELSGTMPEELETPKKSTKILEKKKGKKLIK